MLAVLIRTQARDFTNIYLSFWLTREIPGQGTAARQAAMIHPERVEDYLEHIADAIERAPLQREHSTLARHRRERAQ